MLESLDQVQRGDFLVCVRGPTLTKVTDRGMIAWEEKGFIGTLVQALAVNPPLLITRVFPQPNADGRSKPPFVTVFPWDMMGWSSVNSDFRDEYMQACGYIRELGPAMGLHQAQQDMKPPEVEQFRRWVEDEVRLIEESQVLDGEYELEVEEDDDDEEDDDGDELRGLV